MTGIRGPAGDARGPATASGERDAAALLRGAEEVSGLAPDLGWSEASGLTEGLLDALAHLLADIASGRSAPRPQPVVVGAIGGADRAPDHAGCRAAAARLRAHAPVVSRRAHPCAAGAAAVMTDLADLLDQVADRSRRGALGGSDKGVVLRRLHRLHARVRDTLTGAGDQAVR
ncbi:hypothetical protein [Serinicoccus kebangsaanensis]|uniref:hypothetical protein n=1 Tax=Serinicoccus kebangsaanensis TaxID=2602069 RepID=UPI00124CE016|nr:hypothetical protein [Serinicoccus kebangsaanensis]